MKFLEVFKSWFKGSRNHFKRVTPRDNILGLIQLTSGIKVTFLIEKLFNFISIKIDPKPYGLGQTKSMRKLLRGMRLFINYVMQNLTFSQIGHHRIPKYSI